MGYSGPQGGVAMSDWNYAQWAHAQAHENLKHRLATGDVLLAQANVLLTALLVGIGGALSYAVRLGDGSTSTPAAWGAAAVALWLMWLGGVLLYRCIATRNTDVLGNEPDNLYFPAHNPTELQVREFELSSLQRRINTTMQRNASVAWWLGKCRYAALTTPFIFFLAAWVAGGR